MTTEGGFSGLDRWLRDHRWLPDAALAAILAVVLLPASLPLVLDSSASSVVKVGLTAAIVVAQLAVVFRRSLPVIAYLCCCVAMAVLVVAPPLGGLEAAGFPDALPAILLPSAGVFLVLLYSVAMEGAGRMPMVALLVAGVGVAVTTVRLLSSLIISAVAPAGWPLPVVVLGALAATVLAAWSLGRFLRVRKDYVHSLGERARQAEADRGLRATQAAARERARIAREMHDVVSHSLAVMVAQAEAGRMAGGRDPTLGIAVLPTIASTGRAAMADMRSLLGVLREEDTSDPAVEPRSRIIGGPDPPAAATTIEPGGVINGPAAPLPRLVDIPSLVDRVKATGLPVVLQETGVPGGLEAGAELTAYRVLQEALTNVVKHAVGATSVAVAMVWSPDRLSMSVVDDGAGRTESIRSGSRLSGGEDVLGSQGWVDLGGGGRAGGLGLRGMRERVAAVGGTLSAGTNPDGGFRVIAEIPVSQRIPRPGEGTASWR